MNTTSAHYGTVLGYSCDDGYAFAGGAESRWAECTAEGEWNPSIVECEGINGKRWFIKCFVLAFAIVNKQCHNQKLILFTFLLELNVVLYVVFFKFNWGVLPISIVLYISGIIEYSIKTGK